MDVNIFDYNELLYYVIRIITFEIDYDELKQYVIDNNISLLFDEKVDNYFGDLVGRYYHAAVMLYSIDSGSDDYIFRFCEKKYKQFIDSQDTLDILKVKIPNLGYPECIVIAYYMAEKQALDIDKIYSGILNDLIVGAERCIAPRLRIDYIDNEDIQSMEREYIESEIGELGELKSFRQILDRFAYTNADDDIFEFIKQKKLLVKQMSQDISKKYILSSDGEQLYDFVIEKIARSESESNAIERVMNSKDDRYKKVVDVLSLFRNSLEYSNVAETCFYDYQLDIINRIIESWSDDVDINNENALTLIIFDCLLDKINQMKQIIKEI